MNIDRLISYNFHLWTYPESDMLMHYLQMAQTLIFNQNESSIREKTAV